MLPELGVAAGMLVLQYVYHRWFEDEPAKPKLGVEYPKTEEGTPVPILFGRTIVRQPVLARGYIVLVSGASANAHLLYVLATGCSDGDGTNRVHHMWIGDEKATNWTGNVDPTTKEWLQTGDSGSGFGGGPEDPMILDGASWAEVLNGNPDQVVCGDSDDDTDAPTWAGRRMRQFYDADEIENYRGYLCVFLHGSSDSPTFGWTVASQGQKAFAWEASSYHDNHGDLGLYNRVGLDLNPINAIYCILVDELGKLGLDASYIDIDNFKAVQYTLHQESHGFSRCFSAQTRGDEMLQEILIQIDACIDIDMRTNKIVIKLARGDYNPNELLEINNSNCVRLENFAFGGWTELTNRVRLEFTDRENDFKTDSVSSPNQGNAVAQGSEEEVTISMPGIHDRDLASRIVAREIAAKSKPLLKCRAIVGGEFMRIMRGDVVRLNYRNPDVANVVMRVANVERGTLEDDDIALDLIADNNYVWRSQAPRPPWGYDGPLGEIT